MAKFKIADHILVPTHTALSVKEKEELLEKYNCTVQELPKILVSDAALAGLKVKPGDVVKIERKSVSAGKANFYRRVASA